LHFACTGASVKEKEGCFYVFKTKRVHNYDSGKVLLLSCLPHLNKEQLDSLGVVLSKAIVNNSKARIDSKFLESAKLKGECADHEGWFQFERLLGEAFKERASFIKYNTDPNHLFGNYIVRPLIENERHKSQNGLFIIFGLQKETTKDDIDNVDIEVFRYVVTNKSKIINELNLLGVNIASIFCDIENRVKYIAK